MIVKYKFFLINVLWLSFKFTAAQSGISQEMSKYVNPFTGDFSYSLGMVNISGPNGENYPINIGYAGGGIKMEQEAGWIGLGWNMTSMEISRTVNGVPDDWNGKIVNATDEENSESSKKYYGPIYFKDADYGNINDVTFPIEPTTFDIYQSFKFTSNGNSAFEFPDYDDYNVNVPGISGKMSPKLFDFATLPHSDIAANSNTNTDEWSFGDYPGENTEFSKKPQFVYKNQGNTRTLAPYYSESNYDPSCNCYPPSNRHFWYGDLNGDDPDYSALQTPADLVGYDFFGNYSNSNGENRMHTANYVVYFTNAQINGFDPTGTFGANDLKDAGFLDYKIPDPFAIRRPSGEYDADGIGAFQITDAKGLTYHFSLPVYTRSEAVVAFNLDDNDDITSVKSTSSKNDMYARSWKLTAITGPDYIDVNQNGIADEGDNGYWIYFDYSVFIKNVNWKFPYYGMIKDQASKRNPNQFLARKGYEDYSRTGTVTSGVTDNVYLNYIKTATQTLVFIKDVRNDGHNSPTSTSPNKLPKLLLKKVMLFSNSTFNSSLFDNTILPVGNWTQTTFHTNINENTFNWSQYVDNKTSIDQASLAGVELEYDYSLQKGSYTNIKNSFNTNPVTPLMYGIKEVVSSSIPATGSGKLTLKNLQFTEYKNQVFSPPYKFTYTANNPNYNPNKTDFFGYYKSNASSLTSKYLSGADAEFVDAWMLNEIKTPIGGLINVEYESDVYEGVGYDSKTSTPVSVSKYFRIKDIYGAATSPTIEFYENNVEEFYNSPFFDKKQIYCKYETATCDAVEIIDNGTVDGDFSTNSKFEITSGLGFLNCGNVTSYAGIDGMGYMKMSMIAAYGGGVRVKKISMTEPEQDVTYAAELEYNQGIVTTEPDAFGPEYGKALQASKHGGDRHAFATLVGYSGIAYKYIGADGSKLGSTQMKHFNYTSSYKPISVHADWEIMGSINPCPTSVTRYEVLSIVENNSLFGRLRSQKTLDANDKIISSSILFYDEPENTESDYRVDEVFFRQMKQQGDGSCVNPNITYNTVFFKSERASNLRKEIKVVDGIESTTLYENYDPITGIPLNIIVRDDASNSLRGSRVARKLVYQDPLYSEMGPKSISPSNKNILIPVLKTSIFGKAYSGIVMEGSLKSWGNSADFSVLNTSTLMKERVNQSSLWYPKEEKIFNGTTDDSQWKLTSEVTLLNSKNLPAESKGVDDFYVSERLGYTDRFAVSKAQNSNQNSYTHETFENATALGSLVMYDGDVLGEDLRVASNSSIKAHTGNYYVELIPGQSNPPVYQSNIENVYRPTQNDYLIKGMHTGRKYRASVWVHNTSDANAILKVEINGEVAGTAHSQIYQETINSSLGFVAGEWTLIYVDFELPEGLETPTNGQPIKVSIENPSSSSTNAYFDDLRIQPVDAVVSAFVYDPVREKVLYQIDNNNIYTRYVYDSGGRLSETFIETQAGEKIISRTSYKLGAN